MSDEPHDNPPAQFSSYLTQQQLVSDVIELRRMLVALQKRVDVLEVGGAPSPGGED